MTPRNAVRAAAPTPLRPFVAYTRRVWHDRLARARFATVADAAAQDCPHPVVTIMQEMKPSPFLAGKLVNLRPGAARIDGVVVGPGKTFSFWRLVGWPTAASGFAIRGGVAGADVGGGLCQLSGIIYEAGLRAGLTPVERHPHSRDLHSEAERFTPLGLDATVVWPYQDLRLRNAFAGPLRLRLAVRDANLTAKIDAGEPLAAISGSNASMAMAPDTSRSPGATSAASRRSAKIVTRFLCPRDREQPQQAIALTCPALA